jgi:hypothetical protein
MTVSATDLIRRDKLLGMLTSDFDGERATAAAMLAKLASSYQMTIPEFCQAGSAAPQPKNKSYTPPDNDCEMLNMLRKVIDHHLNLVTPWEEEFLTNVTSRYFCDQDLSEKQQRVAMRILRKVATTTERGQGFRP